MARINKFFDYFEELVLVGTMLVMIAMNFLNVVFRYLFPQSPFSYTEELTLVLFVWATMFGISCGLKRGAHTGMALLTDRLPPLFHKLAIVLSTLMMCLFSCVLLYSGATLVRNNIAYGNILPSLGVSANWKSAAYPIGALLMLYRSIGSGVRAFKSADADWARRQQDKAELAAQRAAEKNARES